MNSPSLSPSLSLTFSLSAWLCVCMCACVSHGSRRKEQQHSRGSRPFGSFPPWTSVASTPTHTSQQRVCMESLAPKCRRVPCSHNSFIFPLSDLSAYLLVQPELLVIHVFFLEDQSSSPKCLPLQASDWPGPSRTTQTHSGPMVPWPHCIPAPLCQVDSVTVVSPELPTSAFWLWFI